jgi:hypothetical protein
VADLSAHWADHPSVQWMVQDHFGYKTKKAEKAEPTETECRSFLDTMAVAAAKRQA